MNGKECVYKHISKKSTKDQISNVLYHFIKDKTIDSMERFALLLAVDAVQYILNHIIALENTLIPLFSFSYI